MACRVSSLRRLPRLPLRRFEILFFKTIISPLCFMLFYDKGCTISGACAAEKSLRKRAQLNLRRLLLPPASLLLFQPKSHPVLLRQGTAYNPARSCIFFSSKSKNNIDSWNRTGAEKNSITDMMKNPENYKQFNPSLTARHVSDYSPSTARSNRMVRCAAWVC